MHGLKELFENVVDDDVIVLSAASGISVVTESGEAPPPADDGRRAETQEEFEIVDGDDQIIVNDEHIIVQEDIIVQGEIMDPEIETFVEELLQETDVICCLCNCTPRNVWQTSEHSRRPTPQKPTCARTA